MLKIKFLKLSKNLRYMHDTLIFKMILLKSYIVANFTNHTILKIKNKNSNRFLGNNWSHLSNPFHVGITYNILGTRLNGMKRVQLLLHPSSLYKKRIALLGSISSLHKTGSVYVFTIQNGPRELFSRQMGCLDGLIYSPCKPGLVRLSSLYEWASWLFLFT